jgi:hypothetical protein
MMMLRQIASAARWLWGRAHLSPFEEWMNPSPGKLILHHRYHQIAVSLSS